MPYVAVGKPRETVMGLTIVNPQERFSGLPFREPPSTGYLHLAAVVDTTVGRTPLPRHTPRKARLTAELKVLSAALAEHDGVSKATVYTAALLPPPSRSARTLGAHPARYDIAVLVETTALDALDEITASWQFHQLHVALAGGASEVLVMAARCARLIADVDKSRQGLFLFNYFAGADPNVALDLWEHLAAWYAAETGMDNSTLLAPLGASDYVLVNHARWDRHLATFMLSQFSKPSFRSYVVANLRANHTASMPILYHLA